ncbi:glutamate 5-kinase [Paraliobacillus quinghaiensis]|uniref:Glutamate 5-kinase n=1 Tax=Paraliobacillus quinghaiensis TaxID=470815 RepID=A0A917TWU6_9BACI|nr:glutamate 5-kinase [Paraliobacillus quinghaiensis]GGM41489.1 glutamate 5-kinase [Paraliobacillus quinghaiensis]
MAKKRVVVKIGSSSLTEKDGSLSLTKLKEHADAIAVLVNEGMEVILISSGAVSAGFRDLGYSSKPVTVSGKQAAAAVGQGLLIEAYNDAFNSYGIVCAQLLLTRDAFVNQEQFSNVYQTINELLKRSVVPIINENDSVAIDELTFGDNDMLSALVSGLVNADYLIMLTDINGIYDANPNKDLTAKKYDYLDFISDDLIKQTSELSSSKVGTGGMKSKLLAAQTALSLGVNSFVGLGAGKEKFLEILTEKGDGTYIGNHQTHHIRKQKQWIAFHSQVCGQIEVDYGAQKAIISKGKSLLPAGIKEVNKSFECDDVVEIIYQENVIAKGQVNYSSTELEQVKGMSSEDAMRVTNRKRPEVIHRNKLVLTLQGV